MARLGDRAPKQRGSKKLIAGGYTVTCHKNWPSPNTWDVRAPNGELLVKDADYYTAIRIGRTHQRRELNRGLAKAFL